MLLFPLILVLFFAVSNSVNSDSAVLNSVVPVFAYLSFVSTNFIFACIDSAVNSTQSVHSYFNNTDTDAVVDYANSGYENSNSATINFTPLNSTFSVPAVAFHESVSISINSDSAINFTDPVFSSSALPDPSYTTSATFTSIGYDDAILQNYSQVSGAEAKLVKDEPRLAASI